MKSICLLTVKYKDIDLLVNRHNISNYYIKYIVYDTDRKISDNMYDSEVRGIEYIYECINDSDCLFISEEIREKYLNIEQFAIENNKEILNVNDNEIIFKRYKGEINIPIVVVAGIDGSLHRQKVINQLVNDMNVQGIKVGVFSENKYSKIYGFNYIPFMSWCKENDINKNVELLKGTIKEYEEKESIDLIVVEIIDTWNSPYTHSSLNASYLLYLLRKMAGIDYMILMSTLNTIEDCTLLKTFVRECVMDAGVIDTVIYDNIILDLKTNYNQEEDSVMPIETTYVPMIDEMKYIDNNEVQLITIDKIESRLCQHVLSKITYQDDECQII